MSEINVTPLVDVMLVLLIIFMITAPLMSHKITVTVAERQPEGAGHRARRADGSGGQGGRLDVPGTTPK